MALRLSIDIATRVSPELSAAVDALVSDPDREEPPTLDDVRVALKTESLRWSREGGLLHPQDRTLIVVELDELIRRHGEDAAAEAFIRLE
jgi:hypothetical protein